MAVSFTVVVPVYNKASYLHQCINSILDVEYEDFEVIAVDDGSTDNSLSILQSYSDPRLKIITGPNKGVSHARNKALLCATKDFITFVDGDDFVKHDFLREAEAKLQDGKVDVLVCGLTKMGSDGAERDVIPTFPEGEIPKSYFRNRFVKEIIGNEGVLGYVASKFVRRRLVIDNNIIFDENLKLAEDLDFWARVYIEADKIVVSRYSGYTYLVGTPNSSMMLSPQHLTQLNIWLRILVLYGRDSESKMLVAKKINQIAEAHFWDLKDTRFSNVCRELEYVNSKLEDCNSLLRMNAKGYLQIRILRRSTMAVYTYLKTRELYHIIRQWLS